MLSCAPPELIEVAHRTGYEYVGLRGIPVTPNEPKYPLGEDRTLLVRTKRALKSTGVRLLDFELARIVPGVVIKDYEPALLAAAELGGRFVLTSGWADDPNFTAEKFEELCDCAAPMGLTICFEFVTFASIKTLSQTVRLLRRANRPNAAICIDTLHFDRSECRLAELDNLPGSWFPYLQICDAPKRMPKSKEGLIFAARADRKFVGAGGLDIAGIVNSLPQVPYSLEIPNLALGLVMSPVDFAREALLTAQAYFERHPRQEAQNSSSQALSL
jgi:sugar phosphate isomerase/epimerase